MRKIINTVIAVVILVGAVFYAQHLIESNERVKPPVKKIIKTVFVQKAINGEVPITAQSSGTVSAKHRLELYAEVQGVFDQSAAEFRSGQAYKKNQILIGLNAREYSASLVAAKSEFQNLVIGVLSDLRLDYADAQVNLLNAQISANGAKYQAKLAELEFLQQTGQLLNVTF